MINVEAHDAAHCRMANAIIIPGTLFMHTYVAGLNGAAVAVV